MPRNTHIAPLSNQQVQAVTALKKRLDGNDREYDLGDFLTFYEDVKSSFILAMREWPIHEKIIDGVVAEVDDYIGNTYE